LGALILSQQNIVIGVIFCRFFSLRLLNIYLNNARLPKLDIKSRRVGMDSDQATAFGCTFVVITLVLVFLVNPFAYGGAVSNIYGINDLSYGQKLLGGLSGFAIPAYFASLPISDHLQGGATVFSDQPQP